MSGVCKTPEFKVDSPYMYAVLHSGMWDNSYEWSDGVKESRIVVDDWIYKGH